MTDTTPTMLADRAVIRISGEDVRGFLQGLVTNDVAGPLPVWAALLTAQGKALFDFLWWEDGADILIDCEAAQADALVRRSIACAARSRSHAIRRWQSIGALPVIRASPIRASPRSAGAGSPLPAQPPKAGSRTACRSA